jgi:hypothetical protein
MSTALIFGLMYGGVVAFLTVVWLWVKLIIPRLQQRKRERNEPRFETTAALPGQHEIRQRRSLLIRGLAPPKNLGSETVVAPKIWPGALQDWAHAMYLLQDRPFTITSGLLIAEREEHSLEEWQQIELELTCLSPHVPTHALEAFDRATVVAANAIIKLTNGERPEPEQSTTAWERLLDQ